MINVNQEDKENCKENHGLDPWSNQDSALLTLCLKTLKIKNLETSYYHL